jgi:hypothetical protein
MIVVSCLVVGMDLEGAIGITPRQFIALFDASGETFRLQSSRLV